MSELFASDLPEKVTEIVRPEPIFRARSMAHVRFRRRDPDQMRRFLLDFGLLDAGEKAGVRYYRGVLSDPYLVAVEPGDDDGFVGFGVNAGSFVGIERLSVATGRPIEEADGPGGGRRVRLTDPDGLIVDVLFGAEPAEPITLSAKPAPTNTPSQKARVNCGVRPPLQPSPVFRLGHVVLQRPNFDRSTDWYMRHLGVIASDVQVLADGTPALAFFRLDKGPEPTDHHSLAILGGPKAALMHVSFETLDIDAVGQGHQYLRAHGWTPYWGVGRHTLGSQFFDYWKDPVGDEWEHYADGDVMTADHATGYHRLNRGSLWTWGDDLPDDLRPDLPLEAIPAIHAQGGFGDMELGRVQQLMEAMTAPPRPWMR